VQNIVVINFKKYLDMNLLFLPLVNWGMGTIIIVVFVIVCIVMTAIVMNMAKGDKKNNKSDN